MSLSELSTLLGSGLVTDPDVLEGYRRDQTRWITPGFPLAVARPSCTSDVQALAAWATRHRIPLVPRGAGTGISGAATASDGCVIVSFERMNRILTVDSAAMLAVVPPGVLNGELKRAARAEELWYPPDPSSFEISTLGGNVATNAGGLCCVKYGVTADYVLGLEAVLPDGKLIRTGGRTRKDVAGYDLTRLLVGSEGTLALITEITVRLERLPAQARTVVALFETLEASGRAASTIVRRVDTSLLEIMDRTTLRAVEKHARLELDTDAAAMLIAESDAAEPAELERMLDACASAGATFVATAEDEQQRSMLLTARRLAYPALERLGDVLADDVAVPLSKLAEMFRRVEEVAERHATLVATVAHAGDGNLHPLIVFDKRDQASEKRAFASFEALMTHALELGGTITGEHGVGTLKRNYLRAQLGPVALDLQKRIKAAFDPLGIMNPGKVFTS